MSIKLQVPVKDIFVTQPFGVNYADFYKKLGMKGHNGIDFWTIRGADCYAAHKGIITWADKDSQGGISIENWNTSNGYKTIHYHLEDVLVTRDDSVEAGQLIGHCDNTGIYTTGDHQHFGLKLVDGAGLTLNKNNGYLGAIDPAPYFPKNWQEVPAWSGYGRVMAGWGGREWRKELFAKMALKKQLGRQPQYLEIMAYMYGGWGIEDIKNPNMAYAWMYRTKEAFWSGDKLQIPITYNLKII